LAPEKNRSFYETARTPKKMEIPQSSGFQGWKNHFKAIWHISCPLFIKHFIKQ
jgi:hypothetical protein